MPKVTEPAQSQLVIPDYRILQIILQNTADNNTLNILPSYGIYLSIRMFPLIGIHLWVNLYPLVLFLVCVRQGKLPRNSCLLLRLLGYRSVWVFMDNLFSSSLLGLYLTKFGHWGRGGTSVMVRFVLVFGPRCIQASRCFLKMICRERNLLNGWTWFWESCGRFTELGLKTGSLDCFSL